MMPAQPRIPAPPNKSLFAMNRWFNKMYLAGLLYHPDEPAELVIDIASGKPTFTPEECVELNKAIESMFNQHGDKVYQVGLRYFHKAMGIKPVYSQA
ncbi:MAG: hypothetical protein WCK81_13400 [Betaproteobacteria bacterium]